MQKGHNKKKFYIKFWYSNFITFFRIKFYWMSVKIAVLKTDYSSQDIAEWSVVLLETQFDPIHGHTEANA